jgi:hypothetical protein
MLKNTLILPAEAGDGALSARLLREAIDALGVVVMLIFGRDPKVEEIVGWADQLCEKFQMTPSVNLRRVVWIRNGEVPEVRAVLKTLELSPPLPRVAVLNFFDEVKATLVDGDDIDPIVLEIAFMKGHAT